MYGKSAVYDYRHYCIYLEYYTDVHINVSEQHSGYHIQMMIPFAIHYQCERRIALRSDGICLLGLEWDLISDNS